MPDLDIALRSLVHLASAPDDVNFHALLCSLPALLRPSIQAALLDATRDDDGLRPVLSCVVLATEAILKGELPFAFGYGPIEQIVKKLNNNEISLDDALQLARGEWIVDSMVPMYISMAVDLRAVQLAHTGQWREAMHVVRLFRAAVEASPPSDEQVANLNIVESVFVEVAIKSLLEVPDRRLLVEAEECGLRVVARTESKPSDDQGLALMRLGVLHFDPYVKGRNLRNYAGSFQLWHEAFRREYGATADKIPRDAWTMPPLEWAIEKAVDYLKKAVKVRQGQKLGESLKAFAEALETSALINGKNECLPEAIEAARRALELLDPKFNAHHIDTLGLILKRLGAPRVAPTFLSDDASLKPHERVGLILTQAAQNQSQQPLKALDSLRNARAFFGQHANEHQQESRLALMATCMRPVFAPNENLDAWGATWFDLGRVFNEKLCHAGLSARELAACAVELALRSKKENKEGNALVLIDFIQKKDPALWGEYEEVVRYIAFILAQGGGVNAFQSGDFEQALTMYVAAFGGAVCLGFRDHALDMIERANDVLKKKPYLKVSDRVLALLGVNWLGCEDKLGERGMLELGELTRRLDRCFSITSPEDFAMAWILWQTAKGLRFGASLAASRPATKLPDSEASLLKDIQELEKASNGDALNPRRVDEEQTLLSFLRPVGAGPGTGPAARLINLQRQFDLLRRRRLASLGSLPDIVDAGKAMEHLDPDTALVTIFLGMAPDDTLAVRWLGLVRGGRTGAHAFLPFSSTPVVTSIDGIESVLHPLAGLVLVSRLMIREEPGFEPICPNGADFLKESEEHIVPALRDILKNWQNGTIRHLCVVPHGPLHFFPFHLLGPSSSPLVDQVVVTYLPNLALLTRKASGLGAGILSVGIGFERFNPRGKAVLKHSGEEAQTIAALFGTSALPEDAATPDKVLELMPRHRYVHFVTHGEQNAFAPSFHHINLAPGINGEDRLFAYNFDGIDLSGVDLVTLSACESALGRFDESDNLRGFAAGLLRAGVRTVVGTLWPTGSSACKTFFSSFYQQLQAGVGKRDAFANAQKETRSIHPTYRAWGSFYLMGAWR
jgi:hypothetical protein